MCNFWRGSRLKRVDRAVIGVLFVFFIAGSFGYLFGIDQANPVETANYILALIRVNDCDGLLEMMPDAMRNQYKPFTEEKRDQLTEILKQESEFIGDTLNISEIREYVTQDGNQAIAAKVKKKGDVTYVIILSLQDGLYRYAATQMLPNADYKALKLIKKAK